MPGFITNRLEKLIFLTGLPRSGTTWAGRALSAATQSVLIEEPFNWEWHPDRISYHMQYLPAGTRDGGYIDILHQEIFPLKRPRRCLRVLLNRRVLIRDVLTPLAIEHVWEQLDPWMIIMVRHPCAVAYSWSKLNFEAGSRLEILLGQERLLEEYLSPFRPHMLSSTDYYFQIGAYWGATYSILRRIAANHPDWQWVTHEYLCDELGDGYQNVLRPMGLEFGETGRRFLNENNRERQPGENPFTVARVTQQEPDKWKNQMTSAQISAVLAGVEPFGVWQVFYNS